MTTTETCTICADPGTAFGKPCQHDRQAPADRTGIMRAVRNGLRGK